ncbi:MAG TPA: T9SS type A sorting domain-containing protein [Bacteroidales bacterium]|nr:T9SS type A sorting domain-containing protein [Bacteroidales bacterium]
MKKIILFLTVTLFMSSASFAQIMTEWEFGPTMFSPSITTNGSPDDLELIAYIKVTNTSGNNTTIKVAREILMPVANQIEQFCWGGICFGFGTDTSATTISLAPGESTEDFSGHVRPQGVSGVFIIKYSFYDVSNPANRSDVIVHFNSIFAVSSEAGEEVTAHARLINGTVNDDISGTVSVHNNSDGALNLIVVKGAQLVPDGTENWFEFGGIQYPSSVDTSGVVSIGAGSIDDSFNGIYNAEGVEGAGTVYYAFIDATNPTAYAVMSFTFDAALGLNEQVLSNTSFSSAYPNPAGDHVSFDYDIPNEVRKAEIVITNLLGAVVQESVLEGNMGTARLNISNLSEGIYFATLKLDSFIATTQKVLVR